MIEISNSMRLILASLLGLCLAGIGVAGFAQSQKIGAPTGSSTFQPLVQTVATTHPVPEGAHILAVPAFAPNKQAWVTIVGSDGQPLSQVSLLVNGVPVDSNLFGQVTFTVPNTGALSLYLQSASGGPIDKHDYALLSNGLLVSAQSAPLVGALISTGEAAWPQLLFSPAFVQPDSMVVLIGTGLEGKPQTDRAIIDGLAGQLFSASADAVLVKIPANLPIGPFKELWIATRRGDTPIVETDAARAELEVPQAQEGKGELPGRIAVLGTSMPTLVQLGNQTTNSNSASVSIGDGQTLSEKETIAMPGGAVNFQSITLTKKSRRSPLPTVRLVNDVPQLSGDQAAVTSSLSQTLDYAILVKLKRRLLLLQSRLQEARLSATGAMPASSTATVGQQEKLAAELRALSLRQNGTAAMLAARHAVFLADGGTEGLYEKAMDDAAGGAYYVLESKVAQIGIVPVSPIVHAPIANAAPAVKPIVLPEVHFKLWPPPDTTCLQAASATTTTTTKTTTTTTTITKSAPPSPPNSKAEATPSAVLKPQPSAQKPAVNKSASKSHADASKRKMADKSSTTQTRSHRKKYRRRH
ncbi:MAG TPA: hypothetical protein V6D22_25570 [Candidatus Obscuribacterales bacterium]